ncbi:hypothetical protein A2U01_0040846, partial [Trifolium medium]|nr:hypothetical protein [Trifolium medium]
MLRCKAAAEEVVLRELPEVRAPERRFVRSYELVKAKRASNLFRFVFGRFGSQVRAFGV